MWVVQAERPCRLCVCRNTRALCLQTWPCFRDQAGMLLTKSVLVRQPILRSSDSCFRPLLVFECKIACMAEHDRVGKQFSQCISTRNTEFFLYRWLLRRVLYLILGKTLPLFLRRWRIRLSAVQSTANSWSNWRRRRQTMPFLLTMPFRVICSFHDLCALDMFEFSSFGSDY